tara:strand:- start:923 stop:1096 length:174 start_codon:yes stop_codon:yes gene_type:complete
MEAKEININNYDLTDYKTVKNLVYMLGNENKRKTKTIDNLIADIEKLIKRIDNKGGV